LRVGFSTAFERFIHIFSTAARVVQCFASRELMMRPLALVLILLFPVADAVAASDATLFRVFLADGTALVSFGEFARLDDRVVFSMPVGGSAEQPRLHVVSIPDKAVDWPRTERYAGSARYQQYANTRGEEDFARLSSDVARVLNEVALTTDPARALQIAEHARKTMADWPREHFGYRQREVREIVSLLDEAISELRVKAGVDAFALSFVAMAADVDLEPLFGMPEAPEMLQQILTASRLAAESSERVSLLQSALGLLNEAPAGIPPIDAAVYRSALATQIREELEVDSEYAKLSKRLMAMAARGAARARVRDVEAVLARIPSEDARLGGKRPNVIQALNTSVQSHLEDARRLRLLRDQWTVRRALYREYERDVGSHIVQLVKAQPLLDAIKRLDGPAPSTLERLALQLAGGALRLERLQPPVDLRSAHELLSGAWRFAEKAVATRQAAIASGNMNSAWEASSAAAGALMMLARAQADIRTLLEPPRLR
jgi:hypothetical protein